VTMQVKDLLAAEIRDLELESLTGDAGLDRTIANPRVQKPGLALAGFLESVRPDRVQVMGQTEIAYLTSLDESGRREAISGFMSTPMACTVVTTKLDPPQFMISEAQRCQIPVLRTGLPSSILIRRLQDVLDDRLSPETSLHGVMLDVFGVGLMLTGPSGIGKSECALDLILRSHRLVADDTVTIRRIGRSLLASGVPMTRHHMEVRGLGIINVKDLFGAASVRERKNIELVVEMAEWNPGTIYDRMGLDDRYCTILGLAVPELSIPIRPGRNLASIIEVAARNHLLKLQGHHAARSFEQKVHQELQLRREVETS